MATRINFIDIYSLYDEVDASVIENLLEDYNISCMVKRLNLKPKQRDLGENSEKRIAVEEDRVENALKIIVDAMKNGLISKEGKFWI